MSTPEVVESAPGPVAAAVVAMPSPVGLHGTATAFDSDIEDWSEYVERLTHYFEANDITSGDKRRAILLNAVGPRTYRLIKTLVSPAKVTEVSFEDIVEAARAHFSPKPSPIVKRYEFNTRVQGEGESIANYVAALRKIAEHCEYGTVLEDMLRDRLVCGISNKGIQRRLLQDSALTFKEAMKVAQSAEAADKDAQRLTVRPVSDKDLLTHRVEPPTRQDPPGHKGGQQPQNRPQRSRRRQPGSPDSGKDCYRCGGRHQPSVCPCRDYDCRYCRKRGHIAKMCRKKARDKQEQEQTHVVTESEQASGPSEEYSMYHVGTGSNNPFHATIIVNGRPLTMEVDTGAAVSIVSETTFSSLQDGTSSLQLQPTTTRLRTYTGEPIHVKGSTVVKVDHFGQSLELPLIVSAGSGPALLGRDWLAALRLDWKTIFTVGNNLTLQKVLDAHKEVFKEGLGELKGVTAKIHVDRDVKPEFRKANKVPFAVREKVERELERLLSLGVIEPIEFSDWAAPIVPVLKGDGRVRICGDYKVTINRAAKIDKYPIPRIEELFASLAGGKTFTKLDLSHAYLQVPLAAESQQYVTVNTHKGLFKYKRLPFGVASAPAIFQRVMETLLQGIAGVCVYLDDILVTGSSEGEHLHNLTQVLQRLANAGMRLKKQKCEFMLSSVSYLGHVISAAGLHTEEAKVRAVVDAPQPKNVTELRSFLGMVNYYGRFLPDLATTLSPLYSLLRQTTSWLWGTKQNKAFRAVKEQIKSGRVLTHFDDRLPLVLACDASPYGLGAVLSHRMSDGCERPVGFASRTLTKAEQNYSHLDKEALAIVYGVKKYHQYLFGRRFEIKTDHKPLTHIFSETRATPTMASGRVQRWALTLGAYDYIIQHREGKDHANADALSRLPLPTESPEPPKPAEVVHLMEHLDSSPLTSAQIRSWTDTDPILSKVRRLVLTGWPSQDTEADPELLPYFRRRYELSTEGGCVLWGSRVIVPSQGWRRALEMLHEAHPGIVRMKSLARGYVWWPGLDHQIEACVKECVTCQSSRKEPPPTPMHPWSWPEKPWSRVHIDYAGPFEGRMFLLLIDAHSKWLEIHPSQSSTSSSTIESLRKSFASLGLPEVLVSDNAQTFVSIEFAEFLKKNGIRHVRTPPYHPASNGLVERAVQTFKEGMKRLRSGSVDTRLARFLLKYRVTPHSSTGVSPAELLMGRRLRTQLDLLHPSTSQVVQRSQDRQKMAHDRRAKPKHFTAGDAVYVRNYRQGPLWLSGVVVDQEGAVLFRVRLADGSVVRRHEEQLRPRIAGSGARDVVTPCPVPDEDLSATVAEYPEIAPDGPDPESPPEVTPPTESQEEPSDTMSNESRRDTVPSPRDPPEMTPAPELRRSTRVRHPPLRYE